MTNSKFHHAETPRMGFLYWACVTTLGLVLAMLFWLIVAAAGGL